MDKNAIHEVHQAIVFGYKVIEDQNLVDSIEVAERRSILERLFTLPWKPFKKYKSVRRYAPKRGAFVFHNMKLVIMHPETAKLLKGALDEKRSNHSGIGTSDDSSV
jgi:hypothetical protein